MAGSISGQFDDEQNLVTVSDKESKPTRVILPAKDAPETLAELRSAGQPGAAVPTHYKLASGCAASRNIGHMKRSANANVLSSREVYRGPVFWITADQVREPSGVEVRRDIVRHAGSVVVMAVDDTRPEPRVLLLRQYRHAAQQYLWELCAGRIDEGESELVAAKRELMEETGYSARHWKRILKFYASPGFVAETMSIYLARGLRAGIAQPEQDEVIDLKFFPLGKAVQCVMNGVIKDAKTIAGVLWLSRQRCR
jgi:ADP-ribose pyrophosphatase